MITIKCIETGDVYLLSGDDETFNMKVYSNLSAAIAGIMTVFLKVHKEDLEYRIAIAQLAGYKTAFHAHERAVMLKELEKIQNDLFINSTPKPINGSYYHEYMRRRNVQRVQNPIIFTDEA